MPRRDDDDFDDRPRRQRRPRKERSFPIVIVLALVPILAIGGYFGYKAIKGSKDGEGSSNAFSASSPKEPADKRAIGDWVATDASGEHELSIKDTGRISITARRGGNFNSETHSWQPVDVETDALTVRLVTAHKGADPLSLDWRVEFLSDTQIKVTPKAGPMPSRTYTKKKLAGLPAKVGDLTQAKQRLIGKWESFHQRESGRARVITVYQPNGTAISTATNALGK
jgi:hypothetical protein